MATAANLTLVQQAYVSFFGRPADPDGQTFWADAIESGAETLATLFAAFEASTEGQQFVGQDNDVIINDVYMNALGRAYDATADGTFWLDALTSGAETKASVTLAILIGATTGDDAAAVANKVSAADQMTAAVTQAQYDTVKADLETQITAVTSDVATVATAVTAAQTAIDAVVDPGTPGTTFTLTTSADTFAGTDNDDTFTGVFGSGTAADNTLSAGDSVNGGAGNDTLSLTAIGNTPSAAIATTNVETISIRDVAGANLNAVLIDNDPTIAFTSTLDAQTSTVNNASLASTFSLAGQGDLTVDFLSTAGTADTAQVAVAGTGSATNSVAVNVSDTNTVEAVTVATSGTNFATITGGTAAAKVTVTGDGTNTLAITGASTLEVDASAATGATNFNMGTTLSVGDNIKGGTNSGDELTATIGSAGQIIATSSGVEKVDLDFTAAGIFNMSNMTDVTAIEVDNDAQNASLTSVASTVASVTLDGAAAANTKAASIAYASSNSGDLALNVGATDSTAANLVVDTGDITVASHTGKLSVQSTGEAANSINALSATASTTLEFGGTKGLTQTGAVTATAMTAMTVTADAGAVALGTVTSDANVATVALSASGAEANDITITNLDLDHVQSVTATATGGADITVSALTFAGTDMSAGAADVTTALTLNAGTSATDTLSDINVTLAEMSTGTNAVWDSITVTGAGDVAIVANDADIDTTAITATTHTGSFNFNGTAQDSATVITLGNASSGETNTVTTGTGNDVITGGTGTDLITGGGGADSITAGLGADTITGGAGADSIDLTEATASIDKVTFTGGATTSAVVTANGTDTIVGFGSTDTLNVGLLGDGTTTATGLTTVTTAAAQGALTDDTVAIITTDGTAANLTTAGTATMALADLTAGTLTNVAAYLSERYTTTNDADQENVIAINFGSNAYIYHVDTLAAGSTAIAAGEITLIATIDENVAAANFVYA